MGRYFLFRKLPLHPRECVSGSAHSPNDYWIPGQDDVLDVTSPPSSAFSEATEHLLALNGFPEPFLKGPSRFLMRWRTEHTSLLVTEDLADLTRIDQVLRVEELVEFLRPNVGSPVSTNRLAQDLGVAFPTVKRWLEALDLVYLTFRIPPYVGRLARAIRKEPKIYFWDWSLADSDGAKLENMVAVQLMRAISVWNQLGLGTFSLAYVRTRDGIECDFVVLNARQPIWLVEVKRAEQQVSSSLLKIKQWLGVETAHQVVGMHDVARRTRDHDVTVISLSRWLTAMP